MIRPRTYRSRLVAYVSVLLAFVVAVLVFTYQASRRLVLEEAENNIARIARQIEGRLDAERRDLGERALMVRDNTALSEYLFITATLGADPGAVRDAYQRQSGWLRVSRVVILTRGGRALLGAEHEDIVEAVAARGLVAAPAERVFYLDGRGGLEMVASAGLHYRSQQLGVVVIAKAIDAEWLAAARRQSGGHLFLVKDGTVRLSSYESNTAGPVFVPRGDVLELDQQPYRVRRLTLDADPALPELWFALSEAEVTARLTEQRDLVLGLTALGCLGVLALGFLMLRRLSAPVSRLAAMIHEVGEGRFPEFPRAPVQDEIGFLWNRFAEMVHSLKEKQTELTAVHRQLETQAITDVLTGLYNRRFLYDLYPKLWSEALRQEKKLAVILVDLDNFKQINDCHGHLTGDKVLVHVTAVLREQCRLSDFLVRMGGEEFLVLTQGDSEGAQILAEKIRATLARQPIKEGEQKVRVTASFGVAEADVADGLNGLEQVLYRADHALYAAKQAGRNRVAVSGPRRLSA
jgi:diguanylate cyclase (GGDEF)-like protein